MCMANVHIKPEPPPFPQPYLGSRPGCGMPSAREPMEHYTDKGRDNFDNALPNSVKFGDRAIPRCYNTSCEWFSEKKNNQCIMFIDIYRCGEKIETRQRI